MYSVLALDKLKMSHIHSFEVNTQKGIKFVLFILHWFQILPFFI